MIASFRSTICQQRSLITYQFHQRPTKGLFFLVKQYLHEYPHLDIPINHNATQQWLLPPKRPLLTSVVNGFSYAALPRFNILYPCILPLTLVRNRTRLSPIALSPSSAYRASDTSLVRELAWLPSPLISTSTTPLPSPPTHQPTFSPTSTSPSLPLA